jgi:hypothetical protein
MRIRAEGRLFVVAHEAAVAVTPAQSMAASLRCKTTPDETHAHSWARRQVCQMLEKIEGIGDLSAQER